jgi:hypothetical protein
VLGFQDVDVLDVAPSRRGVVGTHRTSAGVGKIAIVLLALGASGACASAATSAALPPIPGSETARFRVVVEGTGTAVTDEDLGGSTAVCVADVNQHLTETTTYQRGRGVIVEFTRLGSGRRAPIILRRSGANVGAVLTVVVKTTRMSSGTASRTPAAGVPPEACPPVTEDLSQGPECGKPVGSTAKAGLTFFQGNLKLRFLGLPLLLEIDCGGGQVRGGLPDLRYGWPTPPALRGVLLTAGEIFGRRRVIVKTLDSGQARSTQQLTLGPLSGNATHFGRNRVTIRLIRVP